MIPVRAGFGMINKVKLISLLITTLGYKDALGRSYKDSAPVISLSSSDYIVYAKTDSTVGSENSLTCIASNADAVFWKYKNSSSEALTDDLPEAFKTTQVSSGDWMFTTITDDVRAPERHKINGSYQCFATNTRGYTTISPLIRLVYVVLIGNDPIGAHEAHVFTGRQAYINRPYRLPCYRVWQNDQNVSKLVPPDAPGLGYRWQIRDTSITTTSTTIQVNEDKRKRIDPKTGDLYFAYLTMADQLTNTSKKEYNCWVTPRDGTEKPLNKLRLTINATPGTSTEPEVLYPTATDHRVICIEKTECKVVCIFGGMEAENNTVKVVRPVGSSVFETIQPYGFSFTSATKENSGIWKCQLREKETDKLLTEVKVQVNVLALPKLRTTESFRNMSVTTNSKVEYKCDVENIEGTDKVEFFINGDLVTEGRPSYVTYSDSIPNQLEIKKVQRRHSASIMCAATNAAGSMYETVSLDVYDAPMKSQLPEGYNITSDNRTLFEFNCSFKLDKKTTPRSVKLYWNSNRTASSRTKITAIDSSGIHSVVISPYNEIDNTVESTITLEFNVATQEVLTNTAWWCTVEYNILDTKDFIESCPPSMLQLFVEPSRIVNPECVICKYTYVIVGAVMGFLFLVLLIILTHVFVKKNKGEQYYVDERERKAGHIPEQELEAYAFQDYKRPDQDPIQGSHYSLNFIDQLMGSHQRSMGK